MKTNIEQEPQLIYPCLRPVDVNKYIEHKHKSRASTDIAMFRTSRRK